MGPRRFHRGDCYLGRRAEGNLGRACLSLMPLASRRNPHIANNSPSLSLTARTATADPEFLRALAGEP